MPNTRQSCIWAQAGRRKSCFQGRKYATGSIKPQPRSNRAAREPGDDHADEQRTGASEEKVAQERYGQVLVGGATRPLLQCDQEPARYCNVPDNLPPRPARVGSEALAVVGLEPGARSYSLCPAEGIQRRG